MLAAKKEEVEKTSSKKCKRAILPPPWWSSRCICAADGKIIENVLKSCVYMTREMQPGGRVIWTVGVMYGGGGVDVWGCDVGVQCGTVSDAKPTLR